MDDIVRKYKQKITPETDLMVAHLENSGCSNKASDGR
jgi:hypothetical protein